MAFEKVSNDDNEVLIARFGEEEIKEAIWECGSSKSQGPNGYNFGFIKEFWSLLNEDVTNFLNDFYESDSFVRGANASFIYLIPKISEPQG